MKKSNLQMENLEDVHGRISLKEASERFGYSPDYIGQLIRKGKIPGVQVPANVVWVTTVEAMEQYVKENAGKKQKENSERPFSIDQIIPQLLTGRSLVLVRVTMRALFALAILILICVFYVLSVTVDDYLTKQAEMRAREKMKHAPVQVESLALPQTFAGL